MKKRQMGPCVTFFPQPTTLISVSDGSGGANVMTASWAGIVSKTPPTMAVSLNQARRTYELIRRAGCFAVNMVPASLAVQADYCGLRSGRDDDKLEIAGLSIEPGRTLETPLVAESPLNVECRLSREVEVGDYRLLLGEIVEVHLAEAAIDDSGRMDARAFDPLVYLGGIREYWNLGERIAAAYRDGKELIRK